MAAVTPLPGQTDLDISGLVRYVRVELGLTQPEFGALFDVGRETVSAWENSHKKPSVFKQWMIEAAAEAVERGGVDDLPHILKTCGPAFALWRVLDKSYRFNG